MSARRALREATAEHHARVDRLFGALDLGTPDGYRRFLSAQAGPLAAVEQELDRCSASTLVPDWPSRKRSDLLLHDLEELGVSSRRPARAPDLADPSAQLGAIYVLEGSRLGAAVLKRIVPESAPRRFIAAPAVRGNWQKLLEMLDKHLYAEQRRETAIGAARAVFELFEAAARHDLEIAPA